VLQFAGDLLRNGYEVQLTAETVVVGRENGWAVHQYKDADAAKMTAVELDVFLQEERKRINSTIEKAGLVKVNLGAGRILAVSLPFSRFLLSCDESKALELRLNRLHSKKPVDMCTL